MKCEVTYEVKEVARYVIYKNHSLSSSIGGYQTGADWGDNYGEFQNKRDAEIVREALEADINRRIKQAL